MRISAKVDYAIRAAAELAAAPPGTPVRADDLATKQDIPLQYLENILRELRTAGIVRTQRGAHGGYQLAQAPEDIALADIIRAVEGPLAAVQGVRPEHVSYDGAATDLPVVWVAVRASLRTVLEGVTLAALAKRKLPAAVRKLADGPEAWKPH